MDGANACSAGRRKREGNNLYDMWWNRVPILRRRTRRRSSKATSIEDGVKEVAQGAGASRERAGGARAKGTAVVADSEGTAAVEVKEKYHCLGGGSEKDINSRY